VSSRELPVSLRSAIPQLKKAGYQVRPQVVGPDRIPVVVVNPDADGAAFVAAAGGFSSSATIPLEIDGVPVETNDKGVSSAAQSFCGRFSAQAPNQQDADHALHASGLCQRGLRP
jgi:hypothetical protein